MDRKFKLKKDKQLEIFKEKIENKYHVFNSLFMNLPFEGLKNIGALLPFLFEMSDEGLKMGKSPREIIANFFEKHTNISSVEEQHDLLFKFIQYIERQVVLFDSAEDAAFSELNELITGGTFSNIYQLAKQANKLPEVREKLQKFAVRLVFTAHPTQFYPNSVLYLMQDMRDALQRNDVKVVGRLLQQLGLTPFYKKVKPSPFDEAMSIIYYMRHVYYDTVGKLLKDTQEIFFPDGDFENFSLFQYGFWPGGDRDGNPFVTAEITRKVSDELRYAVLKCYYQDLKTLSRLITFRDIEEPLTAITDEVYENMFGLYKDLTAKKLVRKLEEIKEILVSKYDSLYLDDLQDLISKTKAFGLHFASLDIRQDSGIHTQVFKAIVEKNKLSELPYDKLEDVAKLKILLGSNIKLDPNDYQEEIVRDTIENVYQIKEIQQKNGNWAIHRYIISNCESVVDVLHVYTLFKWCGYANGEINIDIVPLFETMRGLEGAYQTMNSLYNESPYKEHLARRKDNQTIMLGFSDGTKDGGYLKANWEIFRTKETLTEVSRENAVKVVFFDGRGGPPARGGGKTHRFYAAQGKTISNEQFQITIQGQTITSLYGTVNQAYANLEQLVSAGLITDVFDLEENRLSPKERELFVSLAEDAFEKYNDLKAHDMFLPYLERMSTLPYYGKTNIGSRPSKRSGNKKLSLDNLRAIPFVGSWSQLKQNVPGYFGLGTAIAKKQEEGRIEEVVDLYNNSDFFKSLVLNSMMAMTKTNFPLTSYMKDHPEFGDFWQVLSDEFKLSKDMVLEVSGNEVLMQEEQLSKESIRMREEIVLPLLCIQQYALQNIQEGAKDTAVFEKMVTRSLFGNINASRNSA